MPVLLEPCTSQPQILVVRVVFAVFSRLNVEGGRIDEAGRKPSTGPFSCVTEDVAGHTGHRVRFPFDLLLHINGAVPGNGDVTVTIVGEQGALVFPMLQFNHQTSDVTEGVA